MGLVCAVASGTGVCWLGPRRVSLSVPAIAVVASPGVAVAQSANSIVVEGNRRVEAETIRSYFKPGPGGQLGPAQIDEALKALYATGLFQDVRISHAGGRLVVTVVENPVINRVAFEGNKKVKDEQLKAEVQSKPRGTLSRADRAGRRAAHHRNLSPQRPLRRRASSRRSSNCRTTASISCSRSRKATRPASRRSTSSATTPISTGACRT